MYDVLMFIKNRNFLLDYNYRNKLHGYVSNLMGDNQYGKIFHNYKYSNIIGGELTNKGIFFKEDAYFIIRIERDIDKSILLNNISNHLTLFNGLVLNNINIVKVDYNKTSFRTLKESPILISKKFDKVDYINNNNFSIIEDELIKSIKERGKLANIEIDPNLNIKIYKQYNHKDTLYNNIINKGRVFELKINCDEKTKKFILLNGLGRSIGCGFGFIY